KILSLKTAPESRLKALKGLERLLRAEEEWPQLVEVLGQLCEITRDDRQTQVELEFELGSLQASRLADPRRALEHYRTAHGLDPAHRPTLSALERLLQPEPNDKPLSDGDRLELAKLLLASYGQRQDLQPSEERSVAERTAACLEILV